MKRLVLIDANPFLHVGANAKHTSDKRVLKFPVGGIEYLMNYTIKQVMKQFDIILFFDSKTDRKEIMPEYKSNRIENPEVSIQRKSLLELLGRCGFQVEKHDGFESDDLIHWAVKQNYNNYDSIIIATNDADLSCNIDAVGRVQIKSPSTIAPDINRMNYTSAVNRDNAIQYNTITPYKVFYGDKSDNIKRFEAKTPNLNNGLLFTHFVDWMKKKGYPEDKFSEASLMAMWAKENQETLVKEDIVELIRRMKIFYPKSCTLDLTYKPTALNMEMLQNLLSLFRLKESLEMLKLKMIPHDDNMKRYLFKMSSALSDGTYAIDENLPLVSTAFSEVETVNIKGF